MWWMIWRATSWHVCVLPFHSRISFFLSSNYSLTTTAPWATPSTPIWMTRWRTRAAEPTRLTDRATITTTATAASRITVMPIITTTITTNRPFRAPADGLTAPRTRSLTHQTTRRKQDKKETKNSSLSLSLSFRKRDWINYFITQIYEEKRFHIKNSAWFWVDVIFCLLVVSRTFVKSN